MNLTNGSCCVAINASNVRSAGGLQREANRQTIVNAVCVVLLLIIFEGALRKWLFVEPTAQKLIIFVRDPIVLWIYYYSITKRLIHVSPFTIAPVAGAFIILLSIIMQTFTSPKPPVVTLMVYALRNYLLYVPLVQVIFDNFKMRDVVLAIRILIWSSIISAPLMVLQSLFPPDNPINQGFGTDAEALFENLGLTEGLVRGTGLFTSSAGNGIFSTIAFACVLGMVSGQHPLFARHKAMLFAGMAASVTAVLYCGSRSVLFSIPIILTGAILGACLGGRSKVAFNIVIVALLLAALLMLFLNVIVPERLDAYAQRFSEADYYESSEYQFGFIGRILGTFTNVFVLVGRLPFFGYGAGYGTNAAVILGYIPLGESAESDWDRHLYDVGALGAFAVVAFRLWVTGWLGWRCLKGAKRPEGALALTLYFSIAMTALGGQLVGQNTVNGLGWFAIGLCAASLKRSRFENEGI